MKHSRGREGGGARLKDQLCHMECLQKERKDIKLKMGEGGGGGVGGQGCRQHYYTNNYSDLAVY